MTNITMPVLYEKLKAIGLPKDYVRSQGLPTWWDDELDNKPVAALEGAGHISRRLQIDLLSLLQEEIPKFKALPHTKFKYPLQGKKDIPDAAHQLASGIAAAIAQATNLEFKPVPPNVRQVRAEILEKHSQVNLSSILGYCWEHGIAVVYFNSYPKKQRKITGIIQWHGNQPVIVLSGGKTYPACLAFDLAHELGHLAFGHVKKEDNLILIDDKISHDSKDEEEIVSNLFAVHLLVSHFDNPLKGQKFHNGKQLSKKILELIKNDLSIDPCALAFNYAWHAKNFGLANKAIKEINNNQNGHILINHFLENKVDWEDLSDDVGDRLEQILGE